MHSSTDLPLDRTFPSTEPRRGALVQDRPTLGSLPRARRSLGWWLPPVVDLISSSVALAIVAVVAGAAVFPALPVAPLLLHRRQRRSRRLRRQRRQAADSAARTEWPGR